MHGHTNVKYKGTFTFTFLTLTKKLFMKFSTPGTHSTCVCYYYSQTYGFLDTFTCIF